MNRLLSMLIKFLAQLTRQLYGVVLWFFAMITMICSVLSIVGFNAGWLPELSSHFRLVYLGVQLAFLIYVLIGKGLFQLTNRASTLLIITNLILMGINFSAFIPYLQTKPHIKDSQIVRKIKILHINVLGINSNTKPVIDLIQQTKPDILTLAEYNSRWQNALKQSGVLQRFSSSYVVKYGNDGIYSTIPFQPKDVQVDYVEPGKDSTLQLHMVIEKVPVTILLIHPRPPVKPHWYERNKNHFAYLERRWPEWSDHILLIGDLNTSPWSYTFRHFMSQTKLQDSQLGQGIQPSWPVLIPERGIENLPPLIPIDHILHSHCFSTLSRKTGPRIGSDHLPVISELALLKKSTQ